MQGTVTYVFDRLFLPRPSRTGWAPISNGMDMLTRLMYGGRVSLVIGFIVVIIEAVHGRDPGRHLRLLRRLGG